MYKNELTLSELDVLLNGGKTKHSSSRRVARPERSNQYSKYGYDIEGG